jgi:hypothetical protein
VAQIFRHTCADISEKHLASRLIIKAAVFSKSSVLQYQPTRHYIPKDGLFKSHCLKNLKLHKCIYLGTQDIFSDIVWVSCRNIQFEYSEEVTVYGIIGYRYVMSKKLLDNGTSDPGTLCNCGGQCLPQGVLNLTTCRHGGPAFVSLPHFLDADPFYLTKVSGLLPEVDRHQFYLTLEPVSKAKETRQVMYL